jgi:DNA invertase Pin-like site-specific DNA recombinase
MNYGGIKPMRIGYARVSTDSQRLDLQLDALRLAGCEKIYEDTASGALDSRPGLAEAMSAVKHGDVLCVWKLDRLGRSLPSLIDNVNQMRSRGVGFISLQEHLDTTTPAGELIFHIFGALAQFERSLISMRTKAGLDAARLRGAIGGRPAKMDSHKVATARRLLNDPAMAVEDVCSAMKVSKATLYRYLSASAP